MGSIKGLIGSIFGAITGLGRDILNAIFSAVDAVRQWAEDAYNAACDFVTRMGNWAVQTAEDLVNGAISLARSIEAWARESFDSITRWASDWINNVISWARGELSNLGSWLGSWISSVVNWATGELARLGNWAESLFNDAVSWAKGELDNLGYWAERLFTDLKSGLGLLGDWVNKEVFTPLTNFLDHEWHDIFPILQGAWHFLVFVATHPFSWFTTMLQDAIGKGPHGWASDIASAVAKDGGQTVEQITRWLSV